MTRLALSIERSVQAAAEVVIDPAGLPPPGPDGLVRLRLSAHQVAMVDLQVSEVMRGLVLAAGQPAGCLRASTDPSGLRPLA